MGNSLVDVLSLRRQSKAFGGSLIGLDTVASPPG